MTLSRTLPALALATGSLLASACGSDPSPSGTADGTDGTDGTDGSGTQTLSYYADVEPILQQHCVRCHQDGGLGPGDFTDPSVVEALAPAMLGAIDAGRMPPPVSDPDCQDYVGSEHLRLPEASRDVLAAWMDQGQPLGDPADAPPPVVIETELANPDVVVRMPEPYAPTFEDPENPGNEYRCFVLDTTEASGRYVTAMAPVVDADPLVHHIVLFTVPTGSLTEAQQDPQGFDCMGGMAESTDGMIAAWAPGMLPLRLPEGTGLEIPEGRSLVMQMHYFANGTAGGTVADQSAYAFETTDSARPAFMAPVGSYSFAIPAGDPAYTHSSTFVNTFTDLRVVATFPHMHELGTDYDLRIRHEDGSETCVAQGGYGFNNQLTYQFPEPLTFGVGDELEFSCTWNNEEGDSTVYFGERTDEEMCYFFTIVTL